MPGLRGTARLCRTNPLYHIRCYLKHSPFTHCLPGHIHSNCSIPYLHLLPEDPRGRLVQGGPQDLGGHLGQLGLVDLSHPREDRQFRLTTVSYWEHDAMAPYPREGHRGGKLGL